MTDASSGRTEASSERAEIEIREARPDDYEAIAAFTRNTWPDREGGDYIPDVYHDWIEGEGKRTAVAEVGGEVAGLAQTVLLSEWEAWNQGIRVNPEFRGRGVSVAITEDLFEWAREQGATVARNMVFSWNVAGLGQSRSTGYDPATEFRWAHPEPDANAGRDFDGAVTADPRAAWRFWTGSEARDRLRGLALDPEETWALSQLTLGDLRDAADDGGLFVVQNEGTKAFAHRIREYERESGSGGEDGADDPEQWVEYGVGAWEDVESADALFAAVAHDAASLGADRTRVLIPEHVRYVSDAALCRVEISDEPDFVLAADLTA
jgi:GNAT superfamily N-acetyltransferase